MIAVIEILGVREGDLCCELTVPHDFPTGLRIHFGRRGHTLFDHILDYPIQKGTIIRFPAEQDPFISITSPTETPCPS